MGQYGFIICLKVKYSINSMLSKLKKKKLLKGY